MSPTEDVAPSPPAVPGTPRRASAAAKNVATPTTPGNRRASAQAGVAPKSAPAAAGRGSRKRSEPSILADFLLGRPSPARVSAQREASKQRRKSVALDAAGVREELRQEMRAAAVRRLQQPGGVRDRVKAWQKTNTAAMKAEGGGVPHAEDVASEPTEIGAHIDAHSVTEEDRVRIKFRQKPKKKKPQIHNAESAEADGEELTADEPEVVSIEPVEASQPKERPKKRIVSDDNWMKRNKGKGASRPNALKQKAEGSPVPIPKDFLQKTAQNPTVQSKIKDWAQRVEVPDAPSERPKSPSQKTKRQAPQMKQYHTKLGETVTVEEDALSVAEPDRRTKPKSDLSADDGIRVRPMKSKQSKVDSDDGIRILPIRKKEPLDDDGIRVTPTVSSVPDDGIRVRPLRPGLPDDGIRVRPLKARPPDDGIRVRPSRRESIDESSVHSASSESSLTSTERSKGGSNTNRDLPTADVIDTKEESEVEVSTPTRRQGSSRHAARRSRTPEPLVTVKKSIKGQESEVEEVSDYISRAGGSDSSGRPPTVGGNKSLADIPVGYSAFSVLDLPSGARGRNSVKKPKAQRSPSFKAVPNVLRKVMSGAKEIIQERVDPPKPVANKPPSIETWLSNTVDPFVEPKSAEPRAETEKHLETHKRSTSQARQNKAAHESQQRSVSQARQKQRVEEPQKRETSQSRRRETPEAPNRSTSQARPNVAGPESARRSVSQVRQSEIAQEPQKRSLSQARQKEEAPQAQKRSVSQARRAEPGRSFSSQHGAGSNETIDLSGVDSEATPKKAKTPTTPSPGLKRRRATRSTSSPVKSGAKKPFREALKEAFRGESGGHKLPPVVYPSCETDYESVSDPEDDRSSLTEARRRSSGSSKRSPSPDPSSTLDSTLSSDFTDPYPSRKRPPTKGYHELSTIVSEESSTVISDTNSAISQSTITQETAFTKSTDLSRQKSHRSSLRRRLTKHSDLVSVLSLPDNGQLVPPTRSRSVKSSHSLHRKPSKLDRGRIDDLLDEFADDEQFYGRELKTLVDGVVPVLLTDVIRTNSTRTVDSRSRANVGSRGEDDVAKAVVNMGVVLERLRNLHRSVPLFDIRHLLTWLDTVAHVYDDYLDVWRLGFQGLIVNLAPASGHLGDEDSLVNALPRNEDGDVLGEDGERVDVAYLLKRPLIRVKWIAKFLKVIRLPWHVYMY